jgi:MFS family permease
MEKIKNNTPLKLLLFTNGLVLLAVAMLGPIYAFVVEDIGGNVLDAGITYFAFALTAAVITIFAGKLNDKYKENRFILVVGYLLVGIGFLGYTKITNLTELIIVQIIIGIGEAIYSPTFDALYSLHLDKNAYGTEWSIWEAMNYLSMAGGALIGSVIVTEFGFNNLFYIMASLTFLSAIFVSISSKVNYDKSKSR